jgi:phosphate transport system substrate-binding protein
MRRLALVLATLAALTAPVPTAGAATPVQLDGSGSAWADAKVADWGQAVSPDVEVSFIPDGNADGKAEFASGSTDFGVTEIPYRGTDDLGNPDTSSRAFAYVPVLAGSVGLAYRVDTDTGRLQGLRLSARTIFEIFTGQVTDWSDAAITRDNNGVPLPALPITPVVRADESGVSWQLASWFAHRFPADWQAYSGRSAPTSVFPTPPDGKALAGSPGPLNFMSASPNNGTIAFVEPSRAQSYAFPLAKVQNPAGYYVGPSAGHVAVALRGATVADDHTTDLTDVWDSTDPRAYPLSYDAYALIPTSPSDPRMTTAKRQALLDLTSYALCQGQGNVGSTADAPLPLTLVQEGFSQVRLLATADPGVDVTGRDAAHCPSATFAGDPPQDTLDQSVPTPPLCDHVAAGPCGRTGIASSKRSCQNRGAVRICGVVGFWWEGIVGTTLSVTDRPGAPDVGVALRRETLTRLHPTPDGLTVVQRYRLGAPVRDERAVRVDGERMLEAPCDVFRLTAEVGVRRAGTTRWTVRRVAQAADPVGCA